MREMIYVSDICMKNVLLLYFTDHKAHSDSSFFGKIDRLSHKTVRLMYGSGSALLPLKD